MNANETAAPVSALVWRSRYAAPGEPDVAASMQRIALALAHPESHQRDAWRERFEQVLHQHRFLPGGRIWANAGGVHAATLFNCFAGATLPDTLDGVFSALCEAAITLQAGGGVGCDFSPLRPAGTAAVRSGQLAAGPCAFLPLWNAAGEALRQRGGRGAAMMATLRCDHPDIETFIDAKRNQALPHFNLSVLVSDAFMAAVEQDAWWPLVFPLDGRGARPDTPVYLRDWPGFAAAQPCAVVRTVRARALWERLLRAAYECGEPGVIFIDHVQRADNLHYAERVWTCNPCGEAPLPPHGACNLGSLNLAAFVKQPFQRHAELDLATLAEAVTVATRMLDNVYDVSYFPLKAQRQVACASRRIGLGATGLASALAMLGLRYDSDSALELADAAMRTICHGAYRASIALAQERGAFPGYRVAPYLQSEFIQSLPPEIHEAIAHHGIRNSHLTALAPAGGISLLAGNVSPGIDPIRQLQGERALCLEDGSTVRIGYEDHALRLFRSLHGPDAALPPALAGASEVAPARQLELMARLQVHVDQAISYTLNLGPQTSFAEFQPLFARAWRFGLKGCTVYRPGARGRC